jgi:hypothetical protein
VGKFPAIFFTPQLTKLNSKKSEKQDQPRNDHNTISAKPHFNKLLSPTPFLKEFNSFCKEIVNSGDVTG